jgi:hypothetical protein
MKFTLGKNVRAIAVFGGFVLSLSGVITARAAVVFTSSVTAGDAFLAIDGDCCKGGVRSDTADGIKITAPGGLLLGDLNNDGIVVLSLSNVSRNFNVTPSAVIALTLEVDGNFSSRSGPLTVVPNITALNNGGGAPKLNYSITIAGTSGALKYSDKQLSTGSVSSGGLELYGSITITGAPGFRVDFQFPNSIKASVTAVPEPAPMVCSACFALVAAGMVVLRRRVAGK